MPDDLGEYDERMQRVGELDLEELFSSDSLTDQDVAQSWLKKQKVVNEGPGGGDPYRSSLAGLFAQRKVLLDEVKVKLEELARLNGQIEQRASMVLVSYTGVGRLGRWLLRRAWKRIFRSHDVSLTGLLSDMPKGHCADHWECKHDPGVDCDTVREERRGLEQARDVVKEATGGGQSASALFDLKVAADGALEQLDGRENLESTIQEALRPTEQPGLGSRYHELVEERDRGARGPRPFPQPPPARALK